MTDPMAAQVHPTAIVEPGAKLGQRCRIGPYCLVGSHVVLGDDVELRSHVVVTGHTRIGAETVVFSFSVLGEIPQDLKYSGEDSRLEIGARNRIREHVTVNTGTEGGGWVTRIGDDCLLMAGVHVAHDVQIGDRVILVNHVGIAGHCIVGDDVIIGGLAGLHQWVRIGRGAIIGAMSKVVKDVIPYGLVQEPAGELEGLNLIGLKRRGVSRADISALRQAMKRLGAGDGTFMERARQLAEETDSDYVREITDFVLSDTDRSFLTPKV